MCVYTFTHWAEYKAGDYSQVRVLQTDRIFKLEI